MGVGVRHAEEFPVGCMTVCFEYPGSLLKVCFCVHASSWAWSFTSLHDLPLVTADHTKRGVGGDLRFWVGVFLAHFFFFTAVKRLTSFPSCLSFCRRCTS